MNDLDLELQHIAQHDWNRFAAMIGEKGITKAKICLLKQKGRSTRFIAYRVKKSKSTVGKTCESCPIILNS